MDKSSPATGASSPRQPLQLLSGELLRPTAPSDDHAESPSRKRPRLDDSDAPSSTMPSKIIAAHTNSTSRSSPTTDSILQSVGSPSATEAHARQAPQTSNQVSLDLCSTKTSPLLSAKTLPHASGVTSSGREFVVNTSLDVEEREVRLDSLSESMSSPTETPVFEIKVDDLEDEGNAEYPALIELDRHDTSAHEFIETFPYAQQDGLLGSVRSFGNFLSGSTEWAETTHINDLSQWLEEWLQLVDGREDTWLGTYGSHIDFWTAIGVMFSKFLGRRIPFITSGPRLNANVLMNNLKPLLCAYVRLCNHLMMFDLQCTRDLPEDAHMPLMLSGRHIINLTMIFSVDDDVNLWSILKQKHRISTEYIQMPIVIDMISSDSFVTRSLFPFTASLAPRMYTWPGVPELVLNLVKLQKSLASYFATANVEGDDFDGYLKTFAKAAYTGIHALEYELHQNLGNHTTALSAEYYKLLSSQLGHLLQLSTRIDQDTANVAFNKAFGDRDELLECDLVNYPTFLQYSFMFRMWWKFITKGKMELRVIGVANMETELEQLWGNQRNSLWNMLVQTMARLLVDLQVMEYLVGVESHPQLISRSVAIATFVSRTKKWTARLTDKIWTTLTTSSNTHVVNGIFDMLSRTMDLSSNFPCDAFLSRVKDLAFSSFSPSMISFAWQLTDKRRRRDTSCQHAYTSMVDIFVPLIRQSSAFVNGSTPNRVIVQTKARDMFRSLIKSTMAEIDRSPLYQSCIAEILDDEIDATGSIIIITVMIEECWIDDMAYLLGQLNLFPVLCEHICRFISRQTKDAADQGGLHTRFYLFMHMMNKGNPPPLPADLEQRLWSHMVGTDACDDRSRDEAFDLLSAVVTKSENQKHFLGSRNQFIDRCISSYLGRLDPLFFTKGLFRFIDATMKYIQAVSPPSSPAEGRVVQIPLVDIVWHIVLNAANQTVELDAIRLLSQYYLDSNFIMKAPQSAVDATYSALADQCMSQLEQSATALLDRRDRVDVDSGILEQDTSAESAQRRFIRIMEFLERFLSDTRTRPATVSETTELLETGDQITTYDGKPVEIKYQPYGLGLDPKMKVLKIGENATIASLIVAIKQATGMQQISVIAGGSRIDLVKLAQSDVSALPKGLLIVRDVSDKEEQIRRTASSGERMSAFEAGICTHVGKLYEFMDLDVELSSHIYTFLLNFPPHEKVRNIVLSDDNDRLVQLFSNGKTYRILYSITSLRRHLQKTLTSGIFDESFLVRCIELLCEAIRGSPTRHSLLQDSQWNLYALPFFQTLLYFLKECPRSSSIHFVEHSILVDRLCTLLSDTTSPSPEGEFSAAGLCYSVLLELSLHSDPVWTSFSNQPALDDVHQRLLLGVNNNRFRDHVGNSIQNVCNGSVEHSSVSQSAFVNFYWQVLSVLVSKTTGLATHSSAFFAVTYTVFSARHAQGIAEPDLRSCLNSWIQLLLGHMNVEVLGSDDADPFMSGLVRLVALCLLFLKSLKKPLAIPDLMTTLFNQFLFPPTTLDKLQILGPSLTPILDSATRREFYNVVLMLCEDEESCRELTSRVQSVIAEERQSSSLYSGTDRSRWLRTPTGYSGLRNLTNTCYMNSLLTQLYMNTNLRRLILKADVIDADGSQKLLHHTKVLFGEMQDSKQKFADTANFAAAIRPYEGDHIDVAVQMDADEFYNLVFDRWENQFLSAQAKREFRSIYGGQTVTQIKSMDCKHISERLESFLAIQCDVKGKTTLLDSLKTYVEGDMMEGDNKYKCESCGGKFVNAVKRSCLREVPDDLIFHLKRFDFDLTTLQRNKINDYFSFPGTIDMQQYKVEYLHDPEHSNDPDIFSLVGILVHSGTAETGHYYSYIRHDQKDVSSWLEFNDTEVNSFDPSKISDYCFGGPEFRGGEAKLNSAYMLFYRRIRETIPYGPITDVVMPQQLVSRITADNNLLARRYALFGPEHAFFVRALLSKAKSFHSGSCSNDHTLEDSVHFAALAHLDPVISRVKDVPDIESTISAIAKSASNCGTCAVGVLDWFDRHKDDVVDLLILSPFAKVRQASGHFIFQTLRVVKELGGSGYGISFPDDDQSATSDDLMISFGNVYNFLREALPLIARGLRAWDDYFGLMNKVVNLGPPEMSVALDGKVFQDCLEILMMGVKHSIPRNNSLMDIQKSLIRARRPPSYFGLVELIISFMKHLEPFTDPDNDVRAGAYGDFARKKFQLTDGEFLWFNAPTGDASSTTLYLLTRIFEVCEQIESANLPAELVDCLLNSQTDAADIKRIASTLETNINEYHVPFVGPVLSATTVFARQCPDRRNMLQLVATAANSSRRLRTFHVRKGGFNTSVEIDSGGAEAHYTFFQKVALMSSAVCARNEEDKPYMSLVIQYVGTWAPVLLVCDEQEVRNATAHLLEKIIFQNFPEYLDGEETPYEIDTIRTKAVRELFLRCLEHFNKAVQSRLSRAAIAPLATTLTSCATWIRSVNEKEDLFIPFEELVQSSDKETILDRWTLAISRLNDYTDGDMDEGFTEVEYGSNFEDESDETTDL